MYANAIPKRIAIRTNVRHANGYNSTIMTYVRLFYMTHHTKDCNKQPNYRSMLLATFSTPLGLDETGLECVRATFGRMS